MIMPKPLRSSLSENLSGFNASSPTGTIIGIASITVVASIGGADRSKPDAWRLTVEWRLRVLPGLLGKSYIRNTCRSGFGYLSFADA
jgi:hypothetical protein